MAKAIKEHVNVVIGGDGPDHLLGRHYQYAAWYDLLHRIPLALKVAAWSIKVDKNKGKARDIFWRYSRRKHWGRKLWQSLACTSDPCGSGMLSSFCNLVWGSLQPGDLTSLLSLDLLRRTNVATYNHAWVKMWRQHQTSNTIRSYILADTFLDGMCGVFVKVGAMCSAHNLVIHEPYLATPLLRLFIRCKDSWKVDGSWLQRLSRKIPTSETKRILRQVSAELLPNDIILQKQKHGFDLSLVQCW